MQASKNRTVWLLGAVLLILLCCFCLVAAAVVSPLLFGDRSPEVLRILPQITPGVERALPTPRLQTPVVQATPLPPLPAIEAGADLETAIYTNVYARVNPSVVSVRVLDRAMMEGMPDSDIQPFFFDTGEGSGFVIDGAGYIITNRHVVVDASSVVVQFYDGIQAPAEVIGMDRDTDLAVLKVDPQGLDLRPVAFGSIDDLRVGERVIVIGNPFGNTNTLTTGIISALGRQVGLPDTQFRLPEVIQTDAAINPGNSGGPMLNARGEVIGVAFMLQSATQSNAGIGFGIPVYFVQRVADAIIANGAYQHPWMGISGSTLSPFEIRELNLDVESGVLVQSVADGSPAAQAGLRGGDQEVTIQGQSIQVGGDIIIAINGQPVKVFDDLLAYLGRYAAPGDVITLTVIRDGEAQDVPLTLAPRPEQVEP